MQTAEIDVLPVNRKLQYTNDTDWIPSGLMARTIWAARSDGCGPAQFTELTRHISIFGEQFVKMMDRKFLLNSLEFTNL